MPETATSQVALEAIGREDQGIWSGKRKLKTSPFAKLLDGLLKKVSVQKNPNTKETSVLTQHSVKSAEESSGLDAAKLNKKAARSDSINQNKSLQRTGMGGKETPNARKSARWPDAEAIIADAWAETPLSESLKGDSSGDSREGISKAAGFLLPRNSGKAAYEDRVNIPGTNSRNNPASVQGLVDSFPR